MTLRLQIADISHGAPVRHEGPSPETLIGSAPVSRKRETRRTLFTLSQLQKPRAHPHRTKYRNPDRCQVERYVVPFKTTDIL
jgi:hypothetical protein